MATLGSCTSCPIRIRTTSRFVYVQALVSSFFSLQPCGPSPILLERHFAAFNEKMHRPIRPRHLKCCIGAFSLVVDFPSQGLSVHEVCRNFLDCGEGFCSAPDPVLLFFRPAGRQAVRGVLCAAVHAQHMRRARHLWRDSPRRLRERRGRLRRMYRIRIKSTRSCSGASVHVCGREGEEEEKARMRCVVVRIRVQHLTISVVHICSSPLLIETDGLHLQHLSSPLGTCLRLTDCIWHPFCSISERKGPAASTIHGRSGAQSCSKDCRCAETRLFSSWSSIWVCARLFEYTLRRDGAWEELASKGDTTSTYSPRHPINHARALNHSKARAIPRLLTHPVTLSSITKQR